MIRSKINFRTSIDVNIPLIVGEPIEAKVRRIVNNNEPIKDGAELIYTERKDGVSPSHNIRTDRFEIAIEATDKIAKSFNARREERMKVVKAEPSQHTEDGKADTNKAV